MREIKFRAWDKINIPNRMIPWNEILNRDLCGDGWFWRIPHEQINVMQYTGLFDKRGVEIYEGDIVYSKRSGNKGFVFYNEKRAMFMVDDSLTDKFVEPNDDWLDYEVIGNMYENKELLRG